MSTLTPADQGKLCPDERLSLSLAAAATGSTACLPSLSPSTTSRHLSLATLSHSISALFPAHPLLCSLPSLTPFHRAWVLLLHNNRFLYSQEDGHTDAAPRPSLRKALLSVGHLQLSVSLFGMIFTAEGCAALSHALPGACHIWRLNHVGVKRPLFGPMQDNADGSPPLQSLPRGELGASPWPVSSAVSSSVHFWAISIMSSCADP